MKKVFIVYILLCVGITMRAQTWLSSDSIDSFDSLSVKQGLIRLPYKSLFSKTRLSYKFPLCIDNDSLLQLYYDFAGFADDSINLATDILLQSYFGGDCHVRFRHSVFLDTISKKLIWRVYNIYGGCRAGGGRYFVLKVPKPPKGYTIEVEELLVD